MRASVQDDGYKKIKGQYMNRSTFQTIRYMNGSVVFKGQVYEWGRFRNTGSHIRTTITPSYLRVVESEVHVIS